MPKLVVAYFALAVACVVLMLNIKHKSKRQAGGEQK